MPRNNPVKGTKGATAGDPEVIRIAHTQIREAPDHVRAQVMDADVVLSQENVVLKNRYGHIGRAATDFELERCRDVAG